MPLLPPANDARRARLEHLLLVCHADATGIDRALTRTEVTEVIEQAGVLPEEVRCGLATTEQNAGAFPTWGERNASG